MTFQQLFENELSRSQSMFIRCRFQKRQCRREEIYPIFTEAGPCWQVRIDEDIHSIYSPQLDIILNTEYYDRPLVTIDDYQRGWRKGIRMLENMPYEYPSIAEKAIQLDAGVENTVWLRIYQRQDFTGDCSNGSKIGSYYKWRDLDADWETEWFNKNHLLAKEYSQDKCFVEKFSNVSG